MSRMETWLSKEDVLKDLGVVTGRFEDVEDEFIVRGERPPPPRKFEDDEMNLMFGDCALPLDTEIGPDLQGIAHMLQMVNEYEKTEESGTSPDEVITISKLNPNVPEFIPNPAATSSPIAIECNDVVSSPKNNLTYNNKSVPPSIISEDVNECNNTKDCKDINIDKRIDIAALKPEEITDITKKLRSEIIHAPHNHNWQSKRKRNVAIATLLKLYSANSPARSPSPENDKKPILFTPEYFERCSSNAPLEEAKLEIDAPKEDATIKSEKTTVPLLRETNDSEKVDASFSTEPSSSSSSLRSPIENQSSEDPEIHKSIQKVNNWFEKPASPKCTPPKPKGPVLYLEAVSFKRKVNQQSRASDDSTRSTPTNSIATHVEFVPSKYADDLSKMYSERKKTRERQEQDNIWAKAEAAMKAKEEKMRQKQLEKSRSSNASQDESNRDGSGDSCLTIANK